MASYRTEDIRDAQGKLVGTQIIAVDAQGRQVITEVKASDAVGISLGELVDAVAAQVVPAVKAGTAPPKGPALTQPQIQAVAVQVKAKKR